VKDLNLLRMSLSSKYPKDLQLNIFKNLDELTPEECVDNVHLLKYLAYKEVNANVREKFCKYISLLQFRLSELMDK
jgi:hypothetical protein